MLLTIVHKGQTGLEPFCIRVHIDRDGITDRTAWSEAVFYWYFTDIAVLVAVTRYNCHLCLTGEAKQKGGCHDYYFLCYLIHIHLFFMIVFTLFPELSYWYCIGL